MKIKAYRPCETFGIIDSIAEFDTVEELSAYFREWADGLGSELSPVADNDRILFIGTNSAIYDELRNEGESCEQATDEAMETLVVECDDEDILRELASWVAF